MYAAIVSYTPGEFLCRGRVQAFQEHRSINGTVPVLRDVLDVGKDFRIVGCPAGIKDTHHLPVAAGHVKSIAQPHILETPRNRLADRDFTQTSPKPLACDQSHLRPKSQSHLACAAHYEVGRFSRDPRVVDDDQKFASGSGLTAFILPDPGQ